MAVSAFSDRSRAPRAAELLTALGTAHEAWVELPEMLSGTLGEVSEKWGFTSSSTGWGLRILSRDRVVLYMTPCQGHFLVSLVLGERAWHAALASALPDAVRATVENAPRLAEGHAVRIAVWSDRDLDALVTLAQIKCAH